MEFPDYGVAARFLRRMAPMQTQHKERRDFFKAAELLEGVKFTDNSDNALVIYDLPVFVGDKLKGNVAFRIHKLPGDHGIAVSSQFTPEEELAPEPVEPDVAANIGLSELEARDRELAENARRIETPAEVVDRFHAEHGGLRSDAARHLYGD